MVPILLGIEPLSVLFHALKDHCRLDSPCTDSDLIGDAQWNGLIRDHGSDQRSHGCFKVAHPSIVAAPFAEVIHLQITASAFSAPCFCDSTASGDLYPELWREVTGKLYCPSRPSVFRGCVFPSTKHAVSVHLSFRSLQKRSGAANHPIALAFRCAVEPAEGIPRPHCYWRVPIADHIGKSEIGLKKAFARFQLLRELGCGSDNEFSVLADAPAVHAADLANPDRLPPHVRDAVGYTVGGNYPQARGRVHCGKYRDVEPSSIRQPSIDVPGSDGRRDDSTIDRHWFNGHRPTGRSS